MRNLIYNGTKNIVKAGLHCYYKKIKIVGLENVPKDKPVLFLPNHQSALMDVLLIVTDCNRKPYFLTRSDIFGKPFLDAIFNFFRMIPIYRIRDGRDALSKNDAIFDKCVEILKGQETLVIFPEANHNLKRSVRPLSKGFTRILLRAMEKYPTLDIQLVPVGLNYKDAVGFPDEVSLYYGKPISLKSIYKETDLPYTVGLIKKHVTESLQRLTTHIPHDQNYDEIEKVLNTTNVNYLNPTETNNVIQKISQKPLDDATFLKKSSKEKTFLNYLFVVLNFPVLLVWRRFVEPKVWEPEFMATMRLAAAFVGYFLYYLLLLLL
ncbi:MAG: lysophospholipid acyltransferase family protein, partial [Maribacter sp.]